MQANGNGEGTDEHLSRETTHFLVGSTTDARDDGIIATPGSSMVERVAAREEYLCEFFVVVCHHGWAGGFLGHDEEVVDIFDRTERLLPELELDRGVELCKAGVEMVLEDLWIR